MRSYFCSFENLFIRHIQNRVNERHKLKLYIPFKREYIKLFISWGKKNKYKKFTKNQSKKLLKCDLIWIKSKNIKIFNVFIIIFYVNVKKSDMACFFSLRPLFSTVFSTHCQVVKFIMQRNYSKQQLLSYFVF